MEWRDAASAPILHNNAQAETETAEVGIFLETIA
jgi:hypothetical protein